MQVQYLSLASSRSLDLYVLADGLVEQQRLAHVLDFGYRATKVESFCQNNLEYLFNFVSLLK